MTKPSDVALLPQLQQRLKDTTAAKEENAVRYNRQHPGLSH